MRGKPGTEATVRRMFANNDNQGRRMPAFLFNWAPGARLVSNGRGGFDGIGPGVSGQLWRTDKNGGFRALYGPGLHGQNWRVDGRGGFVGCGPGIEGQRWQSDGQGSFVGSGPGIEGQVWRANGKADFAGFGPGIDGRIWRTDGRGGFEACLDLSEETSPTGLVRKALEDISD